ncbi:hypothetical protein DI005_07020 [Prauserella sp. PE36]|uniref:DUF4345 domain-containing protein n=1 Tax=Prauserella endophytica TaxID=1592324 RepID=A0ABY2S8E6_9PSEU|nr:MULTISPECIES: hypothetical protein [Prauserella]PXY25849.1 hypothetical protein BAY59_19955 [Prauserella coralliicola]RBM22254.1 hypothetical protein DI005_07020 [Prauserella sp. PE36]TKG71731.1 hypothetical protein FCN18_09490 [Prauserella endophytica]
MKLPSGAEASVRVGLVAMGVITASPALALLDTYTLEWTYGITDPDAMTQALLQHRGMLQLLLGGALVWAAFFRPARIPAAIGAIAGKVTFLSLILPDPGLRADLATFSTVFDLACIVLLAALCVWQFTTSRARPVLGSHQEAA